MTIVAVAVFNSDRGVPLAVLILLAFVVGMEYVVKRTGFGRHVFAVGGNAEAARRAGIRVNGIRVAVFGIAGTMAAIGGIMAASRLLAVNQNSGGNELLLLAIAGPVIAGTSLFGGRGSVWTALTRRPGDRLDLQRHGPAGALLGGQVHGHRRRPAAGRPGRRDRPQPALRPAASERERAAPRRYRSGRRPPRWSATKSSEAPMAPPRSPREATRTAGGLSSRKRCLPISFVSGSM